MTAPATSEFTPWRELVVWFALLAVLRLGIALWQATWLPTRSQQWSPNKQQALLLAWQRIYVQEKSWDTRLYRLLANQEPVLDWLADLASSNYMARLRILFTHLPVYDAQQHQVVPLACWIQHQLSTPRLTDLAALDNRRLQLLMMVDPVFLGQLRCLPVRPSWLSPIYYLRYKGVEAELGQTLQALYRGGVAIEEGHLVSGARMLLSGYRRLYAYLLQCSVAPESLRSGWARLGQVDIEQENRWVRRASRHIIRHFKRWKSSPEEDSKPVDGLGG